MIVFSFLLALFLSEYVNTLHEKSNTNIQLKSIVSELEYNKKVLQEIHKYNLSVLHNIDSALSDKKFQEKIVSDDEFHLDLIAPQGILFRYFENSAWTIAKNNNFISKIDIQTVSLITKVYEDLGRISNVESEVAKIILDRESRNVKQIHSSLVLIKDTYHGWAVDRTPGLISQIEIVINLLRQPTNQ